MMTWRRGLLGLLMVLGLAFVLTPSVLVGINTFDEGFIASGAMLILRGELPMRDFFVIYGPGQYYAQALLYALFGEDLLVSRIAHAITLGGIGLLVVGSVRSLLPTARWTAPALTLLLFLSGSAVHMPNSGYAAVPALALLLWACQAWSRGMAQDRSDLLVWAYLLVGLTGLLRWDFGVFGFVALIGAGLLGHPRQLPRHLKCALPGLALCLSLFLPFVILGGMGRWLDEVLLFHVREFATWRGKPFWGPALEEMQQLVVHRDRWRGASLWLQMLMMAMPWLLAPLGAGLAWVRLKRGQGQQADWLALALALTALCLLNQVRVRAGLPQGYPAFVAALPLLPYVLQHGIPRSPGTWRAGLAATLGLPLVLLPLYAWYNHYSGLARDARHVPDFERASLVLAQGDAHARMLRGYASLIQQTRAQLAPRQALYSGVQDHSRLFVNDAMLYFLADRPAVTRWVEMEPGLSNSASGQQELVRALEQHQAQILVLLRATSNEANATARSNGLNLLDDYVAQRYRETTHHEDYSILRRRD